MGGLFFGDGEDSYVESFPVQRARTEYKVLSSTKKLAQWLELSLGVGSNTYELGDTTAPCNYLQADLMTSTSTCGSCNTTCPAAASLANVTSVTCSAGSCTATCDTNYDNCNGQIDDGCEVRMWGVDGMMQNVTARINGVEEFAFALRLIVGQVQSKPI
jgi:hypothetical protein